MRNKKKLIILIVQILTVIIFVMSYKSYTDTVMKPIKVYMWAREIKENVQIKETDIVVGEVSSTDYTANMILASDSKSIIGSYTTSRVYPDTYAYYKQVGDVSATTTDLTNLDLTNARVISIPCSVEKDAGAFFAEGDKIDLMFTAEGSATIVNATSAEGEQQGNSNTASASSFTYSKIFLQEVTIYKTLTNDGFKTSTRADRYSGESVAGVDVSDESVEVDSGGIEILLLIVTPEQAEEIKTRQSKGSITVVKRFEESETHESLGYVMGNYGKVFAGNANAETGSLQIISTIQDTDETSGKGTQMVQQGSEVLTEANITSGGSGSNTETDMSNMMNNVSAVIGADSVE